MIFMSVLEKVKVHKARTRCHKSVFPYTVNTSYKTVNLCTLCDFGLPPRKWQPCFYGILCNID